MSSAATEVLTAPAFIRPGLFGRAPLEIATADYESRLATWREWEPVSIAAQGN